MVRVHSLVATVHSCLGHSNLRHSALLHLHQWLLPTAVTVARIGCPPPGSVKPRVVWFSGSLAQPKLKADMQVFSFPTKCWEERCACVRVEEDFARALAEPKLTL